MKDLICTVFVVVLNASEISGEVKGTYDSLRRALIERFDGESDVVGAIRILENKPGSKARQETLREVIEKSDLQEDVEIQILAEILLEKLQKTPQCQKAIKLFQIKDIIIAAQNIECLEITIKDALICAGEAENAIPETYLETADRIRYEKPEVAELLEIADAISIELHRK